MKALNFREEHGKITAALIRKFGPQNLEHILDATQESLLAALQTWPHRGTPENRTAWLITVAQRRMIDQLRQNSPLSPLPDPDQQITEPKTPDSDELQLYFLLCSPKLAPLDQICLILRTLGGLTSAEIARLLHQSEEAIQRRITRAKAKLQPEDLTETSPSESIQTLLAALYLLFTEGYETGRGPDHIRPDLLRESLILTSKLALLTQDAFPEVDALKALMHFHMSRIPARTSDQNLPIFLDQQDHKAYDQTQIQLGYQSLAKAFNTTNLTRYHFEAGLAAAITRQASPEEILIWHEQLANAYPTPHIRLSHAIAIGNAHGPSHALEQLESLRSELHKSPYYHAALGYFLAKSNKTRLAAESYRRAVALSMSPPVKLTLNKIADCLEQSP